MIGILALFTLAQLGAGDSSLETLAILLLAIGFPTIAALLVLLLLCLVGCILERDMLALLCWRCGGLRLLLCHLLVDSRRNLRSERHRIAHQDILLRREALSLKVSQIRAADARTGRSAVPIVGETLAVQLQAFGPPAVAGFMHLWQLLQGLSLGEGPLR